MTEKPSFLTSTFSLVTLIVTTGLVALCIWVKDVTTLKDVTMLLLGGYGVKKGMEATQNSTGKESGT